MDGRSDIGCVGGLRRAFRWRWLCGMRFVCPRVLSVLIARSPEYTMMLFRAVWEAGDDTGNLSRADSVQRE